MDLTACSVEQNRMLALELDFSLRRETKLLYDADRCTVRGPDHRDHLSPTMDGESVVQRCLARFRRITPTPCRGGEEEGELRAAREPRRTPCGSMAW